MKRRTNPTPRHSRPSLPEAFVPDVPVPQDLINSIELWGISFMDSSARSVSLRSDLEEDIESQGGKIVPTNRFHKGCKIHEVFYQGKLAFDLSVGFA